MGNCQNNLITPSEKRAQRQTRTLIDLDLGNATWSTLNRQLQDAVGPVRDLQDLEATPNPTQSAKFMPTSSKQAPSRNGASKGASAPAIAEATLQVPKRVQAMMEAMEVTTPRVGDECYNTQRDTEEVNASCGAPDSCGNREDADNSGPDVLKDMELDVRDTGEDIVDLEGCDAHEDILELEAVKDKVTFIAAKKKAELVLPVDAHPGLAMLSGAGSQAWATKANLFSCMCCHIEDAASRLISNASPDHSATGSQLEGLIRELFRLHDLNGNGMLEEAELIKINKVINEIHYGAAEKAGLAAVEAKYRTLFREYLDPDGKPVPYERFREYIMHLVCQYDKYEEAQAMIVEQWIAEAHTARLLGCGAPLQSLDGTALQKPTGRERPDLQWPFSYCSGEHQGSFSVVRA